MIKYNNKHWFKFLFKRSGYFHDEMLFSIIMYGIVTFLLTLTYNEFKFQIFNLPSTFHTVLGLVIGLLLVFRTNTAYDRWWEGRKQLGALVNTCRYLAMKSKHFLPDTETLYWIQLFPFVLKEHLRSENWENIPSDLASKLPEGFSKANHKPNFILMQLSAAYTKANKNNVITGEQLLILDAQVDQLTDILGACERIKNTPIPFGYSIHLKRILLIYLFTLPFGFIKLMGWYSIPFMLMVFYTMIGIELIGEEIEEPFGKDINDLPFDELAEKIQNNVIEIGEL